ncbi:MAG: dihydroneopterin aldolase family protein [Halobacteriota archaeon]
MAEEEEISDSDRALFEAGIKLGALYHQFTGTPVSTETVEELETAIERSVSLQPWVSSVEVKIDREKVRKCENENQFRYCELSGEMLDVKVVVRYGAVEVHARVKYEEELDYPLMRVERVFLKNRKKSSTRSSVSGSITNTA